MTQCIVKTWRGERHMPLESALTPCPRNEGGCAEMAAADALTALEVLGRLLATLVDRRAITLDEAIAIAGNYDQIEILD